MEFTLKVTIKEETICKIKEELKDDVQINLLKDGDEIKVDLDKIANENLFTITLLLKSLLSTKT